MPVSGSACWLKCQVDDDLERRITAAGLAVPIRICRATVLLEDPRMSLIDNYRERATPAGLERLAARPGWFVPVGTLLDWLKDEHGGGPLPGK